jgi:hypothetical protein
MFLFAVVSNSLRSMKQAGLPVEIKMPRAGHDGCEEKNL